MPNFKISNNKIFLLIAQPLLGDQLMSDLLRMILEPIRYVYFRQKATLSQKVTLVEDEYRFLVL